MNQRIIFLFIVTNVFSYDFFLQTPEKSSIIKYINGVEVAIEIEREKNILGSSCFMDGFAYDYPEIKFVIKVEKKEIWIPRELYFSVAQVMEFSISSKDNLFYMEGTSGDGSESVYFELYFDSEKVVKTFTFDKENKKDTTSFCIYNPVFYD